MKLEDSTGYLVNRVAAAMKLALERRLEPHGVTSQQWAIMATLARVGDTTVVSLAEALGVDVGAASRLIDRLESKQLVSRRRIRADARVAAVSLTESATRLVPRLVAAAESVLDEFLGVLSAKETQTLNQLLRRVLRQAD